MLPNHAPLMVAEQFGTLAALFPDGLIWAWAALRVVNFQPCVRCGAIYIRTAEDFPALWKNYEPIWVQNRQDKRSKPFWTGKQRANHPTGIERLQCAAGRDMGLPFAFAAHFAPEYLYAAARLYRQAFRPTTYCASPI